MRGQRQMLSKYPSLTPVVALAGCLTLMSCNRSDQAADTSSDATSGQITGASQFHLDGDALRVETERALDGDDKAADRVYMHYTTVNPDDRETQTFWMRVAAENGSAGYMSLYARTLYQQGGYARCKRAKFWLKRSSDLAPELAEQNARLSEAIEQEKACQEPDKL
jgi:hypothetical protein